VDKQYDKKKQYVLLKKQMQAVLEDEKHLIPNLANASALINEALENINWVGFYLVKGNELLLGPFQGRLACVHIAVGKGVCGTAAANDAVQLVGNVHQFPGHIACDSASQSEVVVPLHYRGKVVGVLDVDSPSLNRFDETDAYELEQLAQIIERSCEWSVE
jgi:L-methionine (R)-S-oxide reductase